jgi:MoaA/NifB/PqqE/SkfB family radical SAM enzyme
MPLERLLRLVDELVPYKPQNVNLSGGEPLLTKTWEPVAARAKERGLRTILTTNGVFLEENAGGVAELFDQVSVSVACPPEERERLRMGPKGHYEAMVRGLRALSARRAKRRGKRPLLRLLCEVFDSNSDRLGALVQHLEGQGIVFDEILFQHLIFNRPAELAAMEKTFREEFDLPLGLWKGYSYQPRPMDFAAFDRALADLRRRYPQARFSVDLRGEKALRAYYEGRKDGAGAAFCDGPWTQVNVLPNGLVWACPDFVLGSLMDASVRSEERRVGKECRRLCRSRWSPYH